MYNIDIVMEALSLYSENKSFRKTSKILQTKYKLKITRQSIMNWNKWMKNDINKIFGVKSLIIRLLNSIKL